MEDCSTAPNTADDVAGLLREQLQACHESTKACFARATGPGVYYETRDKALALGVRLIQASSNLALALKRLEGVQQNIVVTHATKD